MGVGRGEERLGGGRTPVGEQPAALAVGEAETSDVHGSGAVRGDDVSKAQVESEAAQRAEPAGQPMDLQVSFHRLAAEAAGRPALGVEAVGQFTDRTFEALRDGREVPLVSGDQCRVRLGGEPAGKAERAGGQRAHVNFPQVLASASDSAGPPGPCRKPPGAL